VAMSVNDLIAGGAKPLFFLDYIAIDKMDVEKCITIIKGVNKGCEIADCKLIGGETAEMMGIYLNNKFDLSGFAVGVVENPLPKLDVIDETCVLYGLPSSGIHSNGYTLVRKLLKYYKDDIDVASLLEPTRIYMEVLTILKKYPDTLLGAAHITGGGFSENIPRILPDKLTYKITKQWEIPEVFKWIQRRSKLTDDEMVRTFNCGIGMVLVMKKTENLEHIVKEYGLIEIGSVSKRMED